MARLTEMCHFTILFGFCDFSVKGITHFGLRLLNIYRFFDTFLFVFPLDDNFSCNILQKIVTY